MASDSSTGTLAPAVADDDVAEAASAPEPATPGLAAPEPAAPAWAKRPPLDDGALDTLFRTARSHYVWRDTPVEDATLQALFALLRMGPTSANTSPARFLFLRTHWAKERLRPALSAGNRRALAAPVIAVVAQDPHFYNMLWRLYPQDDAKSWFTGNPGFAAETAQRNATLQGAYLLLAARAVGLDAGPMSGFDNATVDAEFLADRGWKSNFLVALGHGEAAALPPQPPRLSFDEACVLL